MVAMNICTVVTKSHLPHARVLAESFREQHPDGACTVLVLGDPEKTIEAEVEPFEVVRFEEIGVPESLELRSSDVAYRVNAIKPWLFKFLLGRGADHIIYLDPDIQVFAPLNDIGELAKRHGLLLNSRITEPIPNDGEKPTEHELLSAGVYDLGFIALGAGESAARFLEWWSENLLQELPEEEGRQIFIDEKWKLMYRQPLFGDRRWVDLIPSLFPETKVIHDPGCNVAYWNLHARTLEKDGATITVNGERLKFFHFSGFRPELPYWLSKHATRVKVSESIILSELCESYAALLKKHGYDKALRPPYRHGQLPNGLVYDQRLHRLHREALEEGEDFGDVFEPEGAEAFLSWLNTLWHQGRRHGITRFMYRGIYTERPDLQLAFKDLDGAAGAEFARWIETHGRSKHNLHELLMPQPGGKKFARSLAKKGRQQYGQPKPSPKIDGVNVVGLLNTGIGIGEAARGYVSALKAADIRVTTRATMAGIGTMVERFDAGDKENQNAPNKNRSVDPAESTTLYSTNLVCVNAEELPVFAKEVGNAFFENRRTIGVWGWETNSFPERYLSSFELVDELWVYTTYVAKVLSQFSPVPVVVVPPPIATPNSGDTTIDLEIQDGFTFLFLFDFYSTSQRKNPLGLIEAFKRAFAPGEGPQLIIKSIHGAQLPEFLEHLRFAARDRSDIHIVDRYVSLREKTALMESCDCYVSLHRAEGFGLTLAEAMILGKPAIATGYSGNMDFMTKSNSYLVDYTMVEIPEGISIYSEAGGTWAEPDLDHAARLMRQVWENQDEARERGERARRDIERTLSPEAVGKIARARLERLSELQADTASSIAVSSQTQRGEGQLQVQGDPRKQLQVVQSVLKQGPAVQAPAKLGYIGSFARRLVLRLMRPFTSYQHKFDLAMISVLQQMMQSQKQFQKEARQSLAELAKELRSSDNELRRFNDELSRITGALKTRLNPDHPFVSYVDERGVRIMGFHDSDDAADETGTYLGFEDVFRGEEQTIEDRQRWYLDIIADRPWVLDIGCGRGEFLDLLSEQGIKGRGVDIDEAMVNHCRAKGHEVVLSDVNTYLREQGDESIPAIFASQVVEHLPYEDLLEFLHLTSAKLETGGLLIFETVNFHSLVALKTFWLDPTHQHPIFPEVALTLCRLAGFRSGRVVFPNRSDNLEEEIFTALEYAVIATK